MKWAWISVLAVMILAVSFLTVRETENVSAEMWFDFSREGDPQDERGIVLPEYPDTVCHCDELNLWAERAGEEIPLYGGWPLSLTEELIEIFENVCRTPYRYVYNVRKQWNEFLELCHLYAWRKNQAATA